MTRFLALAAAAALLTACAPSPPNDVATGVGFGSLEDFERQRRAREAELVGASPANPVISQEPEGGAPGPAPDVTVNNPGISDTNDFGAVSERETIEDNAERLAAQREVYEVIQPTAVPERPRSDRPNIVEYALGTYHPVGQVVWKRSGFNSDDRFQRACARYATQDQAQEDFLARGGPRNDRFGLDPDGDGYACFWDPTPFRTVQSSGN